MDFRKVYDEKVHYINKGLKEILYKKGNTELVKAIEYSLCSGGKRLRPVLFICACDLVDVGKIEAMPMACALEMIHTYSLIHDDLPAMDNDDYRRGRLTSHKVYGEGMAILAGDGLLNLAYETMINNALIYTERLKYHLQSMKTIANAAGICGMIEGQASDLKYSGQTMDKEKLDYIHKNKTAALISASIVAGIYLGTEDQRKIDAAKIYGNNIGLAFQIADDILDITGTLSDLGKEPGRDIKENKNTYPSIYGLEESKRISKQLIEEAIDIIDDLGTDVEFLKQLATFVITRNN